MSEQVATHDDVERRASYLTEVINQLYPAPWSSATSPGEASRSYVVVPSRRKPRVLIPSASRRLAATALMRYSRPSTRMARLKRDAAAAALCLGLDRLLLPHRLHLSHPDPASAESINGYLSSALVDQGWADIHVTVHIGPARANRKPVLQVLNESSQTVAFVKIGVNDLTRDLVDAEASALRQLATGPELPGLRVPRLLHHGQWNEFTVLVTEALPAWHKPAFCSEARLHSCMRTLATKFGTAEYRLAYSPYLARLTQRLHLLAKRGEADTTTLTDAADDLIRELSHQKLTFGAWHGDWTEWNTSAAPEELYIWDWERFDTDVPLGFDLLHHRLQTDIISQGCDPTTAVLNLISQANQHLAPFGLLPGQARPTVLLYLVDLAARYLTDRQEQAGAALGALGQWLLPTLLRHVAKRSA
ncbi:hypothetical protein [Natronoglycomyces albus]|uniref:Aminoglycoside phosphotransferase domain-containing protein n=1 Tax=Natronoglycomyces albus TaxID=2811108 RepID=A0A895XLG1_9ACTN|nr:hypothetical protein [Natronoglycomyces albus]QSB06174.1 hypothetical protein JQS30_04485 [Natronoglycomyces albus]